MLLSYFLIPNYAGIGAAVGSSITYTVVLILYGFLIIRFKKTSFLVYKRV